MHLDQFTCSLRTQADLTNINPATIKTALFLAPAQTEPKPIMGQHSQIFLLALSLDTFSLSLITYASPPGPVVHCRTGTAGCRVTNAYATFPDRSACKAAAVAYPCTEHELLVHRARVRTQEADRKIWQKEKEVKSGRQDRMETMILIFQKKLQMK